jgi:hypothetical protein
LLVVQTLEYQLLGPGMDAHAVVEMLNLGQIIDMSTYTFLVQTT